MKEEEKYFLNIINSIQYESNAFTVWYSEEKVVIGALVEDNPEMQRFFNYATIYNTIIDTDMKIKYSLTEAINQANDTDFDKWQPLQSPSKEEYAAIYYTENAVFRTAVLWDLLAQLFNLKADLGKSFDLVHAAQIFHNAQQGKKANLFAKKVYAYMDQEENTDVEPWKGNFAYVRDFRNKMTHRVSPNISSFSNYSIELRMPMIYVLKRVIEDYKQVSEFIQEIITDILTNYKNLNDIDTLVDVQGHN